MDDRLRELERRWKESGSREDEKAYRRALGHADHFPIRYVVKTLRIAVPVQRCDVCGREDSAALSSLSVERLMRNLQPRPYHIDNPNQLVPENVHAILHDETGVPAGWAKLRRMVSHGPQGGWTGVAGKHTVLLCADCAKEVDHAIEQSIRNLKIRPDSQAEA